MYVCMYKQANNVVILANPFNQRSLIHKKVHIDYDSITKLLSVEAFLRSCKEVSIV